MKYIFFIYLSILSFTIFSQNQISQTKKIAEMEIKSHSVSQQKSFYNNNIDITYTRYSFDISPSIRYIKGDVTSYFKTSVNIDSIKFELSNDLIIDSVIFHSEQINFSHINNEIQIYFPNSLLANDLDSVSIFYQGIPSNGDGFGSFVTDVHGDDNVPIMWTLSEPYGMKDWVPCRQNLQDKIDSMDLYFKNPFRFRIASNGLLISEQTDCVNRYTHWKHRYPISYYLIAFSCTDYYEFSDYVPMGEDSLQILNYVFPESYDNAIIDAKRTVEFIKLYNEYFIPYPFKNEKYGHAEFLWGGGMEHQTMSFMSSFGRELIAHELAHQWFGDYITLASWHDIWLNEGFATYLTGFSYEHSSEYYWDRWKTNKIDFVTSEPDGSVYVDDTSSVSRVFDARLSYSKGSCLLHMLRWELGDSTFFKGIKNYLTDSSLINGFAETSDLVRNLENAGDTSLSEFFNDWYYGQGYPTYSINWTQNDSLIIIINQEQSHNSVSFFEMDLPIQIIGNNIDTIIRLKNSFSGQEYRIKLENEVSELKFDPEKWIVAKNIIRPSISEINKQNFSFSPNPSSNTLYILITDTKNVKTNIEIFNITGQKMKEYAINKGNNQIDISCLQKGIYFLKIGDDIKKFIKI